MLSPRRRRELRLPALETVVAFWLLGSTKFAECETVVAFGRLNVKPSVPDRDHNRGYYRPD